MPWRPMTPADLPAVSRLAARIHPDFPEADAVFADRLALAPGGCFMAARDGEDIGYLLSHPYRFGQVPALDTTLGALPDAPDTYYLHDLALLPAARGTGLGRAIVSALARGPAREFPTLSLVAVNGSVPFWQRLGFEVVALPALAAKLAGYEAGARYMVRGAVGLSA